MQEPAKLTLAEARRQGKIAEFVAAREADQVGDEAAFNRALQSMAGKSKAVPEASSPGKGDD